ncbi:MAG TPA: hypothetical protein PK674_00475 [Candidatus Absconditabacterales bacterium]|nr:hypothetical protein [Candidatus Absconditabacterales bacterium]HOQ78621.1 hypothetical protein [Candidatus Absconditabacterales bacterium]HPK27802.1 hypothetical protein [Candidatus Absconditabacterales bacterium]
MKTLKEVVNYIHNYMTEYEKGGEVIEKDILYDMMEEELLDTVEGVLTEEDMKNWVNSEDDTFLDKILDERLEDYPGLLESIKNDVLNEYVLGDE